MNGRVSRRQFIAAAAGAGISVKVGFLGRPASAALIANPSDGSLNWIGPDGRPRFRMDAVAKVTGDKTFTRDFRARDVAGWPQEQSHAFLIRGTRADAPFAGLDLSLLGEDLKPDRLVLGEDLVRDGLAPPETTAPGFYGDMFLVPKGRTPRLLGQPVALLIYKDFARFDAAKRLVRFADDVVRWGAVSGYDTPRHYGAGRFVRIGGATSDDPDIYAPPRRHDDLRRFRRRSGHLAEAGSGRRCRRACHVGGGRDRARDCGCRRRRIGPEAKLFLAVGRRLGDGGRQRQCLVRAGQFDVARNHSNPIAPTRSRPQPWRCCRNRNSHSRR
ncbi:hypothetical protein NKH89_19405 [Mesorhizobium sp. M0923]|uniref:hypothetical protein n=1 Tax=Mesorhizobium sp. M0923 TaxID=2957028 RepID=UPI003336AB04